jgi:hypothetical protein
VQHWFTLVSSLRTLRLLDSCSLSKISPMHTIKLLAFLGKQGQVSPKYLKWKQNILLPWVPACQLPATWSNSEVWQRHLCTPEFVQMQSSWISENISSWWGLVRKSKLQTKTITRNRMHDNHMRKWISSNVTALVVYKLMHAWRFQYDSWVLHPFQKESRSSLP